MYTDFAKNEFIHFVPKYSYILYSCNKWFHTHHLYSGFVSETLIYAAHTHTQNPWAEAASVEIPEINDDWRSVWNHLLNTDFANIKKNLNIYDVSIQFQLYKNTWVQNEWIHLRSQYTLTTVTVNKEWQRLGQLKVFTMSCKSKTYNGDIKGISSIIYTSVKWCGIICSGKTDKR